MRQFLAPEVQTWRETETAIRKNICAMGGKKATADYVCERLRPVYDSIQPTMKFTVPPEAVDAVMKVSQFHRQQIDVLLMCLAMFYAELYGATHTKAKASSSLFRRF